MSKNTTMFVTFGLDPDNGADRVWGKGDTEEESKYQCKLALEEYLLGTRRWKYWHELPNNGFKFVTENRDDTFLLENPGMNIRGGD